MNSKCSAVDIIPHAMKTKRKLVKTINTNIIKMTDKRCQKKSYVSLQLAQYEIVLCVMTVILLSLQSQQ